MTLLDIVNPRFLTLHLTHIELIAWIVFYARSLPQNANDSPYLQSIQKISSRGSSDATVPSSYGLVTAFVTHDPPKARYVRRYWRVEKMTWPSDFQQYNKKALRARFHECAINHVSCRYHLQKYVEDLSVIDCHDRRVIDAPVDCAYSALSYVWGNALHEKLLPAGRLPPGVDATIEDAIAVTIDLGLRYLWVDRYCINQDVNSPGREHQINQMHLIYSRAQCMIIAATGNDAQYGLPGVGDTARTRNVLQHMPRLEPGPRTKTLHQLLS